MCVLIAVNQLGFGAIVPVLALYARSFGVSPSAIGLAIAVYGLARVLIAVPVGKLTDMLGRRTALALGGLVTAAGNLLCAYAPNYATFVAARFVAGVGAALVLIAGQIVLADITTPSAAAAYGRYTRACFSSPSAWDRIREGCSPSLRTGRALHRVRGRRRASPPVCVGCRSRTRAPRPQRRQPPRRAVRRAIRLLTSHPGFMLVSLVGLMNAVVRTGALFNVVPVLARDRLLLGTDRIGFGLALSSVVGLVLACPAGVLVDRYGRKAVIVPATVAAGLSMIVFLAAPSYAWFLAACVVWSVAVGISGPAPAAYAADMAPSGMNAAAMRIPQLSTSATSRPDRARIATDLSVADAALATSPPYVLWLLSRPFPRELPLRALKACVAP